MANISITQSGSLVVVTDEHFPGDTFTYNPGQWAVRVRSPLATAQGNDSVPRSYLGFKACDNEHVFELYNLQAPDQHRSHIFCYSECVNPASPDAPTLQAAIMGLLEPPTDTGTATPSVMKGDHLYQFLDENGDGTGNKQAVGDYTGGGLGPTKFFIKPAPGETFYIYRIIITLSDSGALDSGLYGNNIALSNGYEIQKTNGVVVVDGGDFTGGISLKTNGQISEIMYDVTRLEFGSGDEYLTGRFSFDKAGQPLELVGDDGDELAIVFSDDLSGLVTHTFMAQGYSV